MQYFRFIAALGASVLSCASLLAADLGDPASELAIASWVKGEPVKVLSAGKKIYVVEFWATWCPPCRVSIPHLTELQKRFADKNVVVIGVSDEKEETVKPFVQKQGSKMDYRVAIDDERKTNAKYMEAYGIGGIPHAFVVQDRKVIWQGHPMDGLDKALEEITSNRYDLGKAKAKLEAQTLYDQFREAAATGDDAKADELTTKLQGAVKGGALDSFDGAKEKRELRLSYLKNQYARALMQGKDGDAKEAGENLRAFDPSSNLEELRGEIEAQQVAGTYMRAAMGSLAESDRKKSEEQLLPKLKGRPELANNVAWAILTQKGLAHRDVPLALKIAKQACEDGNWKHAGSVDTYARALFESGKKDEAVVAQQKAVAAAEGPEKEMLERNLASYKAGKLPDGE